MGKTSEYITSQHKEFIEKQQLFFISTAPLSASGHINLSPKGLNSFRVLTPNIAGYMDIIESGNETSAHILENSRISFMFCAFDCPPNIIRLYGKGRTILPVDAEWEDLSKQFTILASTRQIIVADIFQVQTSCGFGIPYYAYSGERDHFFKWAESKGAEGLENYKNKKTRISLDGLPTTLAMK